MTQKTCEINIFFLIFNAPTLHMVISNTIQNTSSVLFFCSVIIKGVKDTRGTPKLIDYALATNEEKTQKMTDRQTDRQVYDITQDTT